MPRLFDRNFALLFQGTLISMLGGVVADMAVLWWLADVAKAPGMIALMNTLSFVMMIVLSPIAGAIVDRSSRKRMLVVSDVLTGLVYGGLGLMIWMGGFSITTMAWLVVISVIATDVGGAFYGPASHVAMVDVVARDQLNAANSVLSTGRRVVTVLGQSTGGVLVRALGMPVLMVINGASYLASGLASIFMRFPPPPEPDPNSPAKPPRPTLWVAIKEGFRYVAREPGLRRLVLLYSVFMLFAAPHGMLLLPLYVDSTLDRSADWFGYIMAAYAVGGILGGIAGGVDLEIDGRRRATLIAFLFLSIAVSFALYALFVYPILALVANAVMGFSFGILGVWIVTTYQLKVERPMIGRVMTLHLQLVSACTSLGLALSGVALELWPDSLRTIYMIAAIGACLPGVAPLISKPLWRVFNWRDT